MLSVLRKSIKSPEKFEENINKYINERNKVKLDINKLNLLNTNLKGYSGSFIAINKSNSILKIYKKKLKLNYKDEKTCTYLSPIINEIIVNLVLNNLDKLTKISNRELNFVNKHIIKLNKYGIYNDLQYLSMEKIGFVYNNKYMTNLYDILFENHYNWLVKNHNDDELISLYDKMICNKFKEIFKVIKILQKHINYINSDIKFVNIFIKETELKNNKLTKSGCLNNFILLISDLDKTSIKLNDMNTLIPNYNYLLKKKIMKYRYNCFNYKLFNCSTLTLYDYDFLAFTFNFLLFILNLEKKHKIKIVHKFKLTNKLFKDTLNLSSKKYNLIMELIKKNLNTFLLKVSGNYKYKLSLFTIILINKYCKIINKM